MGPSASSTAKYFACPQLFNLYFFLPLILGKVFHVSPHLAYNFSRSPFLFWVWKGLHFPLEFFIIPPFCCVSCTLVSQKAASMLKPGNPSRIEEPRAWFLYLPLRSTSIWRGVGIRLAGYSYRPSDLWHTRECVRYQEVRLHELGNSRYRFESGISSES